MNESIPLAGQPNIGEVVRRARQRAGLSQSGLASRIGSTQSAVSRWEQGHDEPRLSTLASIVAACGLAANLVIDEDVDRAQIRQQLALSPADRLRSVTNVSRMVTEARLT
jgi:transcriptional regulator with XRE-family HTH domain